MSTNSGTPTVQRGTILKPRPRAARQRSSSLLDIVLDRAQRAAVEQPTGNALLILGEAGHGKTTVAVRRLAHLWRSSPTPLRAAVVVPTEGLARSLQPMLRQLGVDLEVLTYDRWASFQARRTFRRLPRESDSTPPSVMRLKRHSALRLAIEELATREPGRIDDNPDAPAPRRGVLATRGDLQHLFGDAELLERVARMAQLPHRGVLETLERTRTQFHLRAEDEWAHVTERSRLVAVDHRDLDDGTASESADTIDVEDYAVLFELARLRALRRERAPIPRIKTYDVLMLDEAQELAPLELTLLGRSLRPGGTLIVAGDADQHTDESSAFRGWEHTMTELGHPDHESVRFEIGYRCPPEVVALARVVIGTHGARAAKGDIACHAFDDEAAPLAWLTSDLRHLLHRDRRASVAVLCRTPRTARRVVRALHAAEVPARLVFDGRFFARGAVQVTTVDEVKGLEFDFVIIPDAGTVDYPDDAAARRTMYVAVTRARHQVVLACVREPSAILATMPAIPES